MANAQRGEVSFTVDGTPYTFVLDLNAICELEDHFSTAERAVTFDDILAMVKRNSMRHVRAMFWAALRRHHPEMTLEQAADLITAAGGMESFAGQMKALIASTRPDQKSRDRKAVNGTGRPLKAQARSTGGTSTSKPDATV